MWSEFKETNLRSTIINTNYFRETFPGIFRSSEPLSGRLFTETVLSQESWEPSQGFKRSEPFLLALETISDQAQVSSQEAWGQEHRLKSPLRNNFASLALSRAMVGKGNSSCQLMTLECQEKSNECWPSFLPSPSLEYKWQCSIHRVVKRTKAAVVGKAPRSVRGRAAVCLWAK